MHALTTLERKLIVAQAGSDTGVSVAWKTRSPRLEPGSSTRRLVVPVRWRFYASCCFTSYYLAMTYLPMSFPDHGPIGRVLAVIISLSLVTLLLKLRNRLYASYISNTALSVVCRSLDLPPNTSSSFAGDMVWREHRNGRDEQIYQSRISLRTSFQYRHLCGYMALPRSSED